MNITAIIFGLLFVLSAGAAIGLWRQLSRTRIELARKDQEITHGAASLTRTEEDLNQAAERLLAIGRDLSEVQVREAGLQARLEESAKSHAEKIKVYDDAKKQFEDTFKALSADALKSSRDEFLKQATKDFDVRRKTIDDIVKPVRESLKRHEESFGKFGENLFEKLSVVTAAGEKLNVKTDQLVRALRTPQGRGRWGEITLRRVIELAGMTPYCDFTEQTTVESDGGTRQRPDVIVTLPNERLIVIDAKAPLDAYLNAMQSETDEEREAYMIHHAKQVRDQVRLLAGKSYWGQFEGSPEFVVMFIPGDVFLSEALRRDPNIIDDALKDRVVLATPSTLLALLRAVEYGWKQESVAEDARHILEQGRILHERLGIFDDHLRKVGTHLDRAVRSYNDAVGSYESRVLPQARRLEDLNAKSTNPLDDVKHVDVQVRRLSPPASSTDAPALPTESFTDKS